MLGKSRILSLFPFSNSFLKTNLFFFVHLYKQTVKVISFEKYTFVVGVHVFSAFDLVFFLWVPTPDRWQS